MFPVGDANAGGANVKMARLMVASLWCSWVEVKFDVDCIGGEEVMVVVCVWLKV